MSGLRELFRQLAYLVYRWLPKFNYAVVYGWPDFEDTSLALQEGLSRTSVRKVIFFVSNDTKKSPFVLEARTRIVRKDSLRGLLYFLCARYVFFTHRCFMLRFPPNVVSVNVWHGMPIKRIGWMLEGNRGIDSKYSIATSDFWKEIIQKSLRPFEATLVTGHPRNDRLFTKKDVWKQMGIAAGSFKHAVAWLPTYRKSVTGELRNDGCETGNVFGMAHITPESLNDFLRQNNAFAFVKPHPMAPFEKTIQLSNLLIADDAFLRSRGVTLYELLGHSNVMVTDISSVVVDFLILDRPVVHSIPDLEQYGASRGFSMERVTDYLVGPSASNSTELFRHLSQVLSGQDTHAEQRRKIKTLFHHNADSASTHRLLQALGLSN